MGQDETRSLELHPGFPCGWQDSEILRLLTSASPVAVLKCRIAESQFGTRQRDVSIPSLAGYATTSIPETFLETFVTEVCVVRMELSLVWASRISATSSLSCSAFNVTFCCCSQLGNGQCVSLYLFSVSLPFTWIHRHIHVYTYIFRKTYWFWRQSSWRKVFD